ncbi:MAG TPA: hypothetical protein VNR17_10230 [Luteimicrobium sp.]|nr:hypothetical protein [Luteimicrobium sp.]
MSLVTVGSAGVRLVPVADRFAADTKAKLRNLNADVTLKVGNENAFRKQIEELVRDRDMTVDVDANTTAATAKVDEVSRDRDATVNVDADTGAASAKIAAVGTAASGPGGIVTSILALGPALIPVTAAVAGLGAALTAPLAAATVGGGLFAIFAGDSMARIKKIEKEIEKTSTKLSNAQAGPDTAANRAKIKQYTEAIKNLEASLTGATGAFSDEKNSFSEAVGKFEKKNDKSILGPLTLGMKILEGVLPTLTPLIKAMGTGLTLMFTAIGKGLKSDGFGHFISVLASIAGPLFAALGPVIVNIGKGFASLVEAVTPMTGHGFTQGLIRVSEGFANIGQSGGFQKFLGYVRREGPKVWGLVKDLGGAVANLVKGLLPLAGPALAAVSGFAKVLASLDPTILGSLVAGITAVIAATKTWKVVQLALNVVLADNPVGLIITAIGLLVTGFVYAYQHSETFRKIVQGAFSGIKKVAKVVVDWFTQTAFPFLKKGFELVRDGFKAGWDFISKYVFHPLRTVFGWVKDGFVADKKLMLTAWDLLKSGLKTGWDWISRYVFSPVRSGVGLVRTAFSNAKDSIGTTWDRLKTALHTGWSWISKYVFSPFKRGISAIKTAFKTAKDGIGRVWDGIKKAASDPVKFVVNTVYTDGIQSWWNKVAHAVKLDGLKLPDVSLPFATGGVLPGYTPGRDVHQFYSPTGGRLSLSGGEAIMRPEFTRAVGGAAGVARLNERAKRGQAFADGGIWNWLGSTWSKTWHGLTGHFGNPLKLLSKIPGGDLGEMVAELPKAVVGGVKDKIKGLFAGGGKGEAGSLGSLGGGAGSWTGPGMGWQKMWSLVHGAFPGAVLTSAFRPGAIAAGTGQLSMHALGRAIDIGGTPLVMHQVFEWIKQRFPNSKEIIHSQEGFNQVYKGKPFLYPEPTRSMHFNHTHWGYADGGVLGDLLPALAKGGHVVRGGLAKVGEHGAEVVDLPTGSTVYPHGTGPGSAPLIGTVVVQNEHEVFKAAEQYNRRAAIRAGLSRR